MIRDWSRKNYGVAVRAASWCSIVFGLTPHTLLSDRPASQETYRHIQPLSLQSRLDSEYCLSVRT